MRRGLWQHFVSLKTAAFLMVVLSVLLLLNVVLPQAATIGGPALQQIASKNAFNHIVLVRLGFGDMPMSPVFVATLVLLLFNLGAVLIDRTSATIRRIRAPAPSAEGLRKRAAGTSALKRARPDGWSSSKATATLQSLGYAVSRPDDASLFAVKNRTALLGFVIFHASFFMLCAGGLLLYYTRSVSTVVVTEGQTFSGRPAVEGRRAPLGEIPELTFKLIEVEPELSHGQAIQLRATLEVVVADGRIERRSARVNGPASVAGTDLLVDKVGVSAVLRLLDSEGFSVDRVAAPAPARAADVTAMPLQPEGLELELGVVAVDASFPTREQLESAQIPLEVYYKGEVIAEATLTPGATVRAGSHGLRLEEVRYWVRFRVINERGGWLLVLGFVSAVLGLMWRMLLVRREVGVLWDEREIVFVGRSEFFAERYRGELEALASVLLEGAADASGEHET